ncbi:MAG: hydroxymethylglutaryl-CoA lyase [Niabella sp.]|nr:MAG: hydroxymethylglutaryl-CoA lyase [Niabella sp.]
MNKNKVNITECPRDGQQGLPYIIPPEKRAAYINQLMHTGFDTIDFGSFVSPKAVPQMADTNKVLELIVKENSSTKLLAIVGNSRGGLEAANQTKVDVLGFPYSISNTFLEKNINSNLDKVLATAKDVSTIAKDHNKKLRVYISMAFGNPYQDEWTETIIKDAVESLVNIGVHTITLSDTVGVGNANTIGKVTESLIPIFPETEFGLHLHTHPNDWEAKIEAGWKAGCKNFDGVLNGIGGCPMTGFELLGNVNTMHLLQWFSNNNIETGVDHKLALNLATQFSDFSKI